MEIGNPYVQTELYFPPACCIGPMIADRDPCTRHDLPTPRYEHPHSHLSRGEHMAINGGRSAVACGLEKNEASEGGTK